MSAGQDETGRQRDVTAALAAAGLGDGGEGRQRPPRNWALAEGPLRVVPLGQWVAVPGQPGAAEMYVLAATGLPGMLAMTVTMHRPAGPADPPPLRRLAVTTDQLTAADDQDRSYQVSFSGAAGPAVCEGYLDVHPGPAEDARQLSVGATGGPAFPVDLTASAAAAGPATPVGPVPAGEAVLTAIADRLLATGGQDHPAPGRGVQNLGAVVDALTRAGVLPPGSPVPGRLATLSQRLGRPGHGIDASPRDDLPETWASLLAARGGRAVTRNAAAPAAVLLPTVDGAQFAPAGLVTGPDGTRLHVIGTGLRTPGWGLPVVLGNDLGFSWWLRSGGPGGRWHVAVEDGYELGTSNELRLMLTVHPALSPEDGDLELTVTGPAERVRTRLRLRWDPLPW